jgi:hypothetical protein
MIMKKLHNHLVGSISPYRLWHEQETHHVIHWSVFSFGALALFFVLIGSIISYEAEIDTLTFLERYINKAQAEATTETDCASLAAEIWQAAGYSQPFEKTGAELQQGDGCTNPFQPGPKTRSTP